MRAALRGAGLAVLGNEQIGADESHWLESHFEEHIFPVLTPQAIEHQSLETVAQVTEILQGRAPKGSVNADRATRLARL